MGDPTDPGQTKPPGMPRWVKVFGIVLAVVVVAAVVAALAGGHGPGRHLPGGDGDRHQAPAQNNF